MRMKPFLAGKPVTAKTVYRDIGIQPEKWAEFQETMRKRFAALPAKRKKPIGVKERIRHAANQIAKSMENATDLIVGPVFAEPTVKKSRRGKKGSKAKKPR